MVSFGCLKYYLKKGLNAPNNLYYLQLQLLAWLLCWIICWMYEFVLQEDGFKSLIYVTISAFLLYSSCFVLFLVYIILSDIYEVCVMLEIDYNKSLEVMKLNALKPVHMHTLDPIHF